MERLLTPGIRLLNQLRYPQKFLVVSILLVLPLVLAIGLLHSETLPRLAFTQRELAGSQYIARLRQLVDLTQQSNQAASIAQAEQALAHQSEIAAQLAALARDTELEALFATHSAIVQMQGIQQVLQESIQRNDRQAMNDGHLALLIAFRDQISAVGDSSNLILDPELTTYYLMNTAVVQTPAQALLLIRVDQSLDQASTLPDKQYGLLVLAGQLQQNLDSTRKGIQVVITSDPSLASSLSATLTDSLTSATALTEALQTAGQAGPLRSDEALNLSTIAFQSNMRMWKSAQGALDLRLQQRMDVLSQKNTLASGAAIALLICAIYLLAAFYRSTMQTVAVLDQASRSMLAGTHSMAVQIAARDELGQVVTAFNRVAGALVAESQERQASEALRAQLQEQIIANQAATLVELAVPVIPLSKHVLLLPLIGAIDQQRAQQILETLLHGVAAHQADLLILDMTGVRVVDTQVAEAILDAVHGAQLLGARVVLAGVRAEVAQTIVHLTVDLRKVTFYASLQEALEIYSLSLEQNAV